MPKYLRILLLFSVFFLLTAKNAFADDIDCSVSVSPSSFDTSSYGPFNFQITNTGTNDINWVSITPDSNFGLVGFDSDWIGELSNGSMGFHGGTISSGDSKAFTINARTNSDEVNANWDVKASDSYGGDLVSCSGSSSVNLSVPTPAPVIPTPVISNVAISINFDSATVTWKTDLNSSSKVEYGLTTGYGSVNTGNPATSHSLTMSDLSPSTFYHYRISNTGDGGITQSGDLTFTTTEDKTITKTNTVTEVNTVVNTNTVTVTNTVTQKAYVDTTPPVVRFNMDFKKVYTEAPIVDIASLDASGVVRVEYSIDGGRNWIPVDLGKSTTMKEADSKWVPNITDDGDYALIVRATDAFGNTSVTKEQKFTIDKFPPRVGPLLVMMGPTIVDSDNAGYTDLLPNIEYKFILTAAGGPNKITLDCNGQSYPFIKNPDNGIWFSKIKFDKEISCDSNITAIDGAGNIQTANRGKIKVNKLGKFENGTITIFWFDDIENKFVIWDGAPYGQLNPINTKDSGGYGIVLPAGKYYLSASSPGKRTAVSNIIETKVPVFINDDWTLDSYWMFWQTASSKVITPKSFGTSAWTDVNFTLPEANLTGLSTLDLTGKPSIVSLTASWHPSTNEYLKQMDILSGQKVNVIPILMQERDNTATFLQRRGGYQTKIYADPDGEILKDLTVSDYPTTWIVNRYGVVVKEKTGVVTAQEVMDELAKLD